MQTTCSPSPGDATWHAHVEGKHRIRDGPRMLSIGSGTFQQALRQLSMLGAVLKGLRGPRLAAIVREIEKKHFGENETLKSRRYHPIKSAMVWASVRPRLAAVALALIFASTGLVIWWEPLPGPAAPGGIGDYFRDFQGVNGAVLGAQAAFVGIVFPLVIAFVGLLNQGRASFATRLTIYVEETAAIFAGTSSLLLCVAIVVQMPLSAQLPVRIVAAMAVLNIIWFGVNVAALAHFILKTIAYLHPTKRMPIMMSYVANIAWRREFLDIVMQNRWGNVVKYGYLPGEAEPVAIGYRSDARVSYSPLIEAGNPIVSKHMRRPVVMADVHFGLLSPIVRAWLSLAQSTQDASGHDLTFPLMPQRKYEGTLVLARSTLRPGLISRTIIRLAFRFKRYRQNPVELSQTAHILKEIIADLLVLIDQRQADEFGTQLRQVLDFHAFFYAVAQMPDEDFNYAQIETGLSRELGTQWASEYRNMQRRATERLGDEPEFFGACAYVGAHIYERCQSNITPAALKPLLLIPNNLFHHLMVWAANEYKAEGGELDNPGGAFTLQYQNDGHSAAWRSLVAGWERLLDVIARGRSEEDAGWPSLKRHADNIREHLRRTAQMVGRAAWSGDMTATEWSTDLLLNWIARERRGRSSWLGRQVGLQPESITYELFELDWESISELPVVSLEEHNLLPSAVFDAIMGNAWRDTVVTLSCICIHWSIGFGHSGTATRAAYRLLNNRRHDRGDTGVYGEGQLAACDILSSILRIVGSSDRFSAPGYNSFFEDLAEHLGELRDNPWVSMRIYSSSGGLGFSALYTEHALAIMAVGGDARLDGALRRMLTQDDDTAVRSREDYLRQLLNALDENINADEHGEIIASLSAIEAEFDQRKEAARKLVVQALQELTNHRDRAIQTAQIDDSRLRTVATAAASRAFGPNSFPLNLFAQIEYTEDSLTAFTLRALNQDRGAYTDPLMSQLVSNEEEWWRETMRQQVASVVWRDVLQGTPFESLDGSTPEAFWRAVRDGATRLRDVGENPILVIGSITEPRWIFDWRWQGSQHSARRPPDMMINRDVEQPEGYEFSMNGIPVFRGQTFHGEAYLIPRALLHKVRFHRYDNGLEVSPEFIEEIGNPWRGTLAMEYQRDVELDDVLAFRIRFDRSEDERGR